MDVRSRQTGVGKVLVVPSFPASGYFIEDAAMASAMQHDLAAWQSWFARAALTTSFTSGELFFERTAFVVRHLGDVARRDVHGVTGEYA